MTFKFYKLLIVSQTSPVEGQKPVRTADTEFNSGVVQLCWNSGPGLHFQAQQMRVLGLTKYLTA